MKKKIAIAAAALVTTMASSALAADGPYIGGYLGMANLSDSTLEQEGFIPAELSFDSGLGFGFVLGTKNDGVRIEAEVARKSNDLDQFSVVGFGSEEGQGDVSATSLMINVFKDIDTQGAMTPYFGGGIGFSNLDAEIFGVSADDTVFSYQFGAGLGIAMSEKATLDFGYRYFATADPDFEGIEAEYDSHNFNIGLRTSF